MECLFRCWPCRYMSANIYVRVCIFFFLVNILLTGARKSDSVSQSSCDLKPCLDLFTLAEEKLQIYYPSDRGRSSKQERNLADSIRSRCIAYRTFTLCIANMSRPCLGDIGYHSSQKASEKQMKLLNCSIDGPVFEPPHRNGYEGPAPAICSFSPGSSGPAYVKKFCQSFGDPHVERFDGTQETCNVVGAWPLVDNEYISVQATSEAAGSAGGSAITKVTVIIKQHEECALSSYVTYQASRNLAEPLPSTFDDGLVSFGPADSVMLSVVTPETSHRNEYRAEIYLRYIDTLVTIRFHPQSASLPHLSVSIRMPAEVIATPRKTNMGRPSLDSDAPLQLCVTGCPKSLHVSLSKYFNEIDSDNSLAQVSQITIQDALRICSGLIDFYLDSCVFDVHSTSDFGFNMSARLAFNDAMHLNPSMISRLQNRTSLSSRSNRASPVLYISLSYSVLLFLLYLITVLSCR